MKNCLDTIFLLGNISVLIFLPLVIVGQDLMWMQLFGVKVTYTTTQLLFPARAVVLSLF